MTLLLIVAAALAIAAAGFFAGYAVRDHIAITNTIRDRGTVGLAPAAARGDLGGLSERDRGR